MSRRRGLSETDNFQQVVQSYVAAGGDEQVQQVITAVHRLSRRLNQSYDRQLADLDVSTGEWAVLAELARAGGEALTPSRLAEAAGVAPSSMTHRLDRMVERGLIDPEGNFTGWHFSTNGGRSVTNEGLLPPVQEKGQAVESGGDPVAKAHRAHFAETVSPLVAQLDALQRTRAARARLVITGLEPGDLHVDGLAVDDRCDGIEEGERIRAGRSADRFGEIRCGEGTRGDDREIPRLRRQAGTHPPGLRLPPDPGVRTFDQRAELVEIQGALAHGPEITGRRSPRLPPGCRPALLARRTNLAEQHT
jgi:hypothetical protein